MKLITDVSEVQDQKWYWIYNKKDKEFKYGQIVRAELRFIIDGLSVVQMNGVNWRKDLREVIETFHIMGPVAELPEPIHEIALLSEGKEYDNR